MISGEEVEADLAPEIDLVVAEADPALETDPGNLDWFHSRLTPQ